MKTRVWMICAVFALSVSAAANAQQTPESVQTFSQAVKQVINRPEFRHVSFGLEIYSLDQKKVLSSLNGEKFFTPGSTTKLLTEGTALNYLGSDYRFHTSVYRTGPISRNGNLKGNLVLVASGDPNLSNRMQPDGTLVFADEDHSYGGPDSRLIPGNPAQVMEEFAKQIKLARIRKVQGHVLVDVSLFPEGERELGTGMVISPISVNDNVIDATVIAGATAGAPAKVVYSLHVPDIQFVNKITTGAPGSNPVRIHKDEATSSDGTQTVILSGTIPPEQSPYIYAYPVSSPSRFAQALLTEALGDDGIKVENKMATGDAGVQKSFYTPEYRVAEHVSAPFSEEVKVTLKVSQNLHASMTPFLLGALVGKATDHIEAKGFALEHDFLTKGGLDLNGSSQADGAGGAESAFFTPDFMVHYLEYMSQQQDFPVFKKALPILGRDGTLVKTQTNSPAAGNVFAKTGTFGAYDMLNKNLMLVGKGLAGYTTTASGEHVCFAFFANHLEVPAGSDPAVVAGDALGAIVAAAHDLPIDNLSLGPP